MGQFSWITSDYNEPAYCEDPKSTVYVPIPRDFQDLIGTDCLVESDYQGYGVFGGRDIFALVAIWNNGAERYTAPDGELLPDDEIRGDGIDIACYDSDNLKLEYPIKITSVRTKYEDAEPSLADPNQGWHIDLICDCCGATYDRADGYEDGDECPECGEGSLYY